MPPLPKPTRTSASSPGWTSGQKDFRNGIHRTNEELQIKRAALHAWKVTFLQPFSNQLITLEAPLPEDFTNVLGNHFSKIICW